MCKNVSIIITKKHCIKYITLNTKRHYGLNVKIELLFCDFVLPLRVAA